MLRKRKMNPAVPFLLMGTLAALGIGAAVHAMRKPRRKPKTKPSPGMLRRGPDGRGYLFGSAPQALVKTSIGLPWAIVSADCSWVIEGDSFLPQGGSKDLTDEDEHLDHHAGLSSAWPHVRYLLRRGAMPRTASIAIAQESAKRSRTVAQAMDYQDMPVGVCSNPPQEWVDDLQRRIQAWVDNGGLD